MNVAHAIASENFSGERLPLEKLRDLDRRFFGVIERRLFERLLLRERRRGCECDLGCRFRGRVRFRFLSSDLELAVFCENLGLCCFFGGVVLGWGEVQAATFQGNVGVAHQETHERVAALLSCDRVALGA